MNKRDNDTHRVFDDFTVGFPMLTNYLMPGGGYQRWKTAHDSGFRVVLGCHCYREESSQ